MRTFNYSKILFFVLLCLFHSILYLYDFTVVVVVTLRRRRFRHETKRRARREWEEEDRRERDARDSENVLVEHRRRGPNDGVHGDERDDEWDDDDDE